MKKLIFLSLVLILLSCDERKFVICYECSTMVIKERCDTIEKYIIKEKPICDWTERDARQYEDKNTFTEHEKCFILNQLCFCFETKVPVNE